MTIFCDDDGDDDGDNEYDYDDEYDSAYDSNDRNDYLGLVWDGSHLPGPIV